MVDTVYNDVISFLLIFLFVFCLIVIASKFWMTYKYKRIHVQCSPTIQCSVWNLVWVKYSNAVCLTYTDIHSPHSIKLLSMNECLLELFLVYRTVTNTINDFFILSYPLSIWRLLSKVNIRKVLMDQSGSLNWCFMNYKWSFFFSIKSNNQQDGFRPLIMVISLNPSRQIGSLESAVNSVWRVSFKNNYTNIELFQFWCIVTKKVILDP